MTSQQNTPGRRLDLRGLRQHTAYRSAPHRDDRVVAITALRRRRQARDVTYRDVAQQPLDRESQHRDELLHLATSLKHR